MKRLNAKQQLEQSNFVQQIRDLHTDLNTAIRNFNAAVAAEYEKVQDAHSALEAVVEAAEAWREDIHDDMESYYDERSERWQDGDAGSAYADWREAWDESLDMFSMDDCPEFDELDDDSEIAQKLEELPTEPDA